MRAGRRRILTSGFWILISGSGAACAKRHASSATTPAETSMLRPKASRTREQVRGRGDGQFAEAPIGGAAQAPVEERPGGERADAQRDPHRHVRQIKRQPCDHVRGGVSDERKTIERRQPRVRQRLRRVLGGVARRCRQTRGFGDAPARIGK
jgi:hypothetical protein